MDTADDHPGAGRVYQPVFIRITRESGFPNQQGNQINQSVEKELEHGRYPIFLFVPELLLFCRLLFDR